jgi:uncharacterized protein (DUF1697 family)
MLTYVSLLRGVNVGRQKRIKSEELITLFEFLGFKNVKTYVQSGNIIFNSDENIKELQNIIEKEIKQVFSFPVGVLLRTSTQLQQIINSNPFLVVQSLNTDKLHITFLSNTPNYLALSQIAEIQDELDIFVANNKEIYLYCPNGYGKTKYTNGFFERKLGITATTRNWKTVNTLFEIAKNLSV